MSERQPITELVIRPIEAGDRKLWEPLWKGYADFYQRTVPAATTEVAWKRLTETHEVECLLALRPTGEAVGLVHFFFHAAMSTIGNNCYMPDLFVVPEARSLRVGRRLIAAVTEIARARGAAVLYWQTEEFNGPARRLYERIAKRSPFIRYQIDL